VRSREESHLQGGVDRTGDPILTSKVFHAMLEMVAEAQEFFFPPGICTVHSFSRTKLNIK